jgi:putative SOS response-associated peptidase YedK
MCGRYQLVRPELLARVYGVEQGQLDALGFVPNANVRPTQRVPVLLGEHDLALVKWGFVAPWAKDAKSALINARAEGLADKPTFRRAFRSQRCLIPASGFYEWQAAPNGGKRKTPYLFTVKNAELFTFAGLWEVWTDRASGEELRTCAIITTTPNTLVAPVHDRMPVILRREDQDEWVDPDLHDVGRLGALLQPYPAEAMSVVSANSADLRA